MIKSISEQSSDIDNGLMNDWVINNLRITTVKIAKRINGDNSTESPHLKQLGYT